MTRPDETSQIKQRFIDQYPEENLRPDEVRLLPDGDVVIDRRVKYPNAQQLVVGRWKPGTGRPPFSLVND
ncbi:hypothetical protein FXF51_06275 [Nonomuraea sp. PA05]|uniref:hypothetical protein n=1 Tax=Nonomuraea sp. PA05 TaxID=2604466 RepID=UPI0011D69A57|nr:hypothetical protein [Nonomuraea sp. PA05]TYB69767.1 hypothetical protein FXF51_06275 [Nonomuraea sp. PA05]